MISQMYLVITSISFVIRFCIPDEMSQSRVTDRSSNAANRLSR